MILEYGLTERHARAILRLKEPKMRSLALRRIHEERLNVAASEEMIEKLLGTPPKSTVQEGFSARSDALKGGGSLQGGKRSQESNSIKGNKSIQGNKGIQGSSLQEDDPLGMAEKGRELRQIQDKAGENTAVLTVLSPQTPPKGCVPRKFAIPDLTPLYNSIERTLSIFRKTGASVSCMREEGTDGVRIIIEIPKNA